MLIGMAEHLHIRLTLRESDPAIVRELLVPADYSVYEFHLVLQVSLGWNDYEPFEFVRPGLTVGVEPAYSGAGLVHDKHYYRHADEVEARELFERVGQKIAYTYDFSRLWQFEVVLLEKVQLESELPSCVLVEQAAPLEDADDLETYYGILIAAADPTLPIHDMALSLLGEDFQLAGPTPEEVTEHLELFFGEELAPHGIEDADDEDDAYGWWDPSKYDEAMRLRVLKQEIEREMPRSLRGPRAADRSQALLDALKGLR